MDVRSIQNLYEELIADILHSLVWASAMMYMSSIWLLCALLRFLYHPICLQASVSKSATSAAWSNGRHHDDPLDLT